MGYTIRVELYKDGELDRKCETQLVEVAEQALGDFEREIKKEKHEDEINVCFSCHRNEAITWGQCEHCAMNFAWLK